MTLVDDSKSLYIKNLPKMVDMPSMNEDELIYWIVNVPFSRYKDFPPSELKRDFSLDILKQLFGYLVLLNEQRKYA